MLNYYNIIKSMSNRIFHNDTSTLNHLWWESHKNIITSLCIEFDKIDQIDNMVKKFLGEKIKIKTLKDPNRPKRGKTSYLFFCNEKRKALMDEMRKNNDKINVSVIQKKLGGMWGKLSDNDKVPYVELSIKDKERYLEEMEVYKSL